ncbi:MAG: type II secretion system F family protein [Kiritimatiellae bacterium]|nr:type II secretion system F family protein [Kiritimatiellia bacterium]
MKTFDYKGYNSKGQVRKGLIEALSVKDAREKLAATGILTERLTATGRQLRLSSATRSVIYRELSALLDAGLPLVDALEILVSSPEVQDARLGLAGIRDRVREGASLAVSFDEASSSVTNFEVSIIEAAERSATVAEVLARLADFLDEQEELRQSVQAALVYPLIVIAVGICVAVLMLGVLIPRTRDLLSAGNGKLPLLTSIMMSVGQAVVHWGVPVLILVAIVAYLHRRRAKNNIDLQCRRDQRLFGLPIIGRGYKLLVNERFCRTMAILLDGGVSLIESLVIAGRATGSVWITTLALAESDKIRHGDKLSSALERIPPMAEFLPGWVRVGEAGGGMARLLSSAAQRYGLQWRRFLKLHLSFLEPLIILLIGGFVLLITLAVLLPIMNISKGM